MIFPIRVFRSNMTSAERCATRMLSAGAASSFAVSPDALLRNISNSCMRGGLERSLRSDIATVYWRLGHSKGTRIGVLRLAVDLSRPGLRKTDVQAISLNRTGQQTDHQTETTLGPAGLPF